MRMRDISEDTTPQGRTVTGHSQQVPSSRYDNQDAAYSVSDEPVEKVKPNKKYVCFEDAHKFAKSLGLSTRKEWRQYVKGTMTDKPAKPSYIPAHPDGIYKTKGWQGWKFWLGTADQGLLQ